MYNVYISDGDEPLCVTIQSMQQVLDLISLLDMANNRNIGVSIYVKKEVKKDA